MTSKMYNSILATRLPIRLAVSVAAGFQSMKSGRSTINSSCRYLTCGSVGKFASNRNGVFTSGNAWNANLENLSHKWSSQLLLPTGEVLGSRGIIRGVVSAPKQNHGKGTQASVGQPPILEEAKKLGLFARFRLMYKQYWYVLIPVHVITSIGWFGGFYYLSQSGVDIPALLQTLHVSESIIDKLKDSSMGHLAFAYVCYKIATPARYMITVGGTTISIKYLEQYGYIKPMPSKTQLIQMYEDKKADRAKRKQQL